MIVPATYTDGVIKPLKRIKNTPSRIFLFLEYEDKAGDNKDGIIDLKKITGIIDKDFKDMLRIKIVSPKEFVKEINDLQDNN